MTTRFAGGTCLLLTLCLGAAAPLQAQPVAIELTDPKVERAVERLVDSLRDDDPALRRAHDAWANGQRTEAAEAILEHFNQKTWPNALVDQLSTLPDGPEAIAEAEAILKGTFTLQGVTGEQAKRSDGGLAWSDRGPRNDPEWAWMLNRHHWLKTLAGAWRETGDARFVEAADRLLADWIRANDYPGRPSYSAAWRPLEAARRIDRAWIESLVHLRTQPAFLPETRLLMLASLLDHADSLRRFHSPSGNHRLTERVMLAKLAVWFPEFQEADDWAAEARDDVLCMIQSQVYPDGSYKELANHYQRIAAEGFADFYQLFAATGRQAEVAQLRLPLEGMYRYLLLTMRPNGKGPLNNDSDLDDNRKPASWAAQAFERRAWSAMLNGQALAPLSHFFPWAGQLIMRDGWGDDALWGFFDAGPLGTQHEHHDRLHLSISLGQQDMLVDAGRYTYQPGPWRRYFKGPASHNLVTLDGAGTVPNARAVPQPLPIRQAIDGGFAWAQASAPFEGIVPGGTTAWHTRAVVFYPGEGWLVLDEILAFGAHEVCTQWHFHPDLSVTVRPPNLLSGASGDGEIFLELHSLSGPSVTWQRYHGVEHPEPRGWYSADFNERTAATQLDARQLSLGTVRNLWLIASSPAKLAQLRARWQNLKPRWPLTKHPLSPTYH